MGFFSFELFLQRQLARGRPPRLLTHPSHIRSSVSLGLHSLAFLLLEWHSRLSSMSGSRWSTHRSFRGEEVGHGEGIEHGEGLEHGEGIEHGEEAGEGERVRE